MRHHPAILLAALSAVSASTAQTVPAVTDPGWVETEIERPLPPGAAALGRHGIVTLEGDITAEGRTDKLMVSQSSRSSLLDATALQKFANVRVSGDLPAGGARKIRLKVLFSDYDLDNMGLGYLCGQAVRDAGWYASAFPDHPVESNKFKTYLQGMGLFDKRLAFAQDKARFEQAWVGTIAICREAPNAPVMGTIVLVGNRKAVRK